MERPKKPWLIITLSVVGIAVGIAALVTYPFTEPIGRTQIPAGIVGIGAIVCFSILLSIGIRELLRKDGA